MAGSVKVSGTWRNLKKAHVRVGGTWRPVKKGFTRVGGTWVQWLASDAFYLAVTTGSIRLRKPIISTDSSNNCYVSLQYRAGSDPLLMQFGSDGSRLAARYTTNHSDADGVFTYAGSNLVYMDTGRGVEILNPTTYAGISRATPGTAFEDTRWRIVSSTNSNKFLVASVRGSAYKIDTALNFDYFYFSNSTANLVVDAAISSDGSRSALFEEGDSQYGSGVALFNGGTLVYNRAGGNYYARGGKVAVADDGTVYMFQVDGSSSNSYEARLVKIATTGNPVWGRRLSTEFGTVNFWSGGIVLGDDGFLYVAHTTFNSTLNYISKWDTDGNLIWQRQIDWLDTFDTWSIAQRGDALYVSMQPVNDKNLTMRLPTDGAFTGTYTVGAETVTISASSFLTGSIGLGFSTRFYMTTNTTANTTQTPGLTSTNYSPTTTTITI